MRCLMFLVLIFCAKLRKDVLNENINERALRLTTDAGSGAAAPGRIHFLEGYFGSAGYIRQVHGADYQPVIESGICA